MSRPAVFLDRDGTIIEDVGFLRALSQIDLLPWSADAIRQLNDAGFAVVVITNQSGVGRGYYDEAHVQATHAALDTKLNAAGARIEGYYYCPHYPGSVDPRYGIECDCRKPRPGLILEAASRHGIDLAASFMVGDRWRDIDAGAAAGCRTILIDHGYQERAPEHAPDAVVRSLAAAADWILSHPAPPTSSD